jgi:hypothetical protein
VVFQVQYYDMPRLPGARIESPATLGRKCWAFAYLAHIWSGVKDGLVSAVAAADGGLNLSSFVAAYESAVALTMPLCGKVMVRCLFLDMI